MESLTAPSKQGVTCYCGSPASLQSNAVKYGRKYGNGLAWICSRWPKCDGYVGTHPNGKPLGTLADSETQRCRSMVHAQIDPIWRNRNTSKRWARAGVYMWLKELMNMSAHECHVGNFTKEQCMEALEQIALHPFEDWKNNAT